MSFILMLLIMALSAIFIWRWQPKDGSRFNTKTGQRFQKLWDDAYEALRTNKFLKAERALLTILKSDEKNAAAYSRLGILYAKQKDFSDAIECFEIARSIEPSPSSLHNLGLIYYETGSYDKASDAFEVALHLEDNIASRYIAYAKVKEKLGKPKDVVKALQRAAVLEPSHQTYSMLADAYERNGQFDESKVMRKKLDSAKRAKIRKIAPRIRQPRRIVM